jgi:hypothetical protein
MDVVEAEEVPKPRREPRPNVPGKVRRNVRRRSGFRGFNAPPGPFPEERSRFSKEVDWEKDVDPNDEGVDEDSKYNSPEYHRKRHDL